MKKKILLAIGVMVVGINTAITAPVGNDSLKSPIPGIIVYPLVEQIGTSNDSNSGSIRADGTDLSQKGLQKYELEQGKDQVPSVMDYSASLEEICFRALYEWNSDGGPWANAAESRGLTAEGCTLFLK